MSLSWNIQQIANKDELKVMGFEVDGGFTPHPEGDAWVLRADAENLVWLSLACGYNEITERNWREVYTRIAMYETLAGAMRHDHSTGTPVAVYFMPDEVKRCIGLTTSALKKTAAQFDKQIVQRLRETVQQLRLLTPE